MEVRILEFRPRPSGARQGFVDVELPDLGLVIKDIVLFRSYSRAWCKMPARRIQLDDDNVTFMAYVTFAPRLAERVEQAICDAVEAYLAAGVA